MAAVADGEILFSFSFSSPALTLPRIEFWIPLKKNDRCADYIDVWYVALAGLVCPGSVDKFCLPGVNCENFVFFGRCDSQKQLSTSRLILSHALYISLAAQLHLTGRGGSFWPKCRFIPWSRPFPECTVISGGPSRWFPEYDNLLKASQLTLSIAILPLFCTTTTSHSSHLQKLINSHQCNGRK